MALGDSNSDTHLRPQLRYARVDSDGLGQDSLVKALELARKVEELLEDTRSVADVPLPHDPSTHSTRMARAMAASLVDELEALVRPARKTGTS